MIPITPSIPIIYISIYLSLESTPFESYRNAVQAAAERQQAAQSILAVMQRFQAEPVSSRLVNGCQWAQKITISTISTKINGRI